MEFFAVIIGIGIGYALYRKNRANREEEYDDDEDDDYDEYYDEEE